MACEKLAARNSIRDFHLRPAGCYTDKRKFRGRIDRIERRIVYGEPFLFRQFELRRYEFAPAYTLLRSGKPLIIYAKSSIIAPLVVRCNSNSAE